MYHQRETSKTKIKKKNVIHFNESHDSTNLLSGCFAHLLSQHPNRKGPVLGCSVWTISFSEATFTKDFFYTDVMHVMYMLPTLRVKLTFPEQVHCLPDNSGSKWLHSKEWWSVLLKNRTHHSVEKLKLPSWDYEDNTRYKHIPQTFGRYQTWKYLFSHMTSLYLRPFRTFLCARIILVHNKLHIYVYHALCNGNCVFIYQCR